jgi:3-oxoacyl-[acyl-carrier protein] reductase
MSGFVAAIAEEFGPSGITANVISPGVLSTPRNVAAAPDDGSWDPVAASVLRRRIEPAEVAEWVALLLDARGAPVNGQTLRVDGGMIARRPVTSPPGAEGVRGPDDRGRSAPTSETST